ncbi:biotin-dependent carboxyltransferase family protein [Simiduia curdlanivorans]|uniref:Biotin-dependent carboxyltransferase family protein n=1 Tax=Simiduia curdlanivorans TaxID=1492769 RepID=A0ABV8V202_9GAMM|nr:biotin-dependent carboxyltransferase family protein [Simiduia curdlanivorans]MDN3638106.1 biotin-dependent carboxyltransferase family protein [Simiduia curdlanivorans]
MSALKVIQPGFLSLLMDAGRLGQHGLGLTTGGPLDEISFYWANRLCQNPNNTTLIEASVGGLELEALANTSLAVTGANMPLTINGQSKPLWATHSVRTGDKIKLGFATAGARCYLAVAGGFDIEPQFGSTATVVREGIGGLNGKALAAGDQLALGQAVNTIDDQYLALEAQPTFASNISVRVILGYQEQHFSAAQKALFFSNSYEVSNQCNRMGYRLTGPAIKCEIGGIVSEGICLGAIQVPADGQPIVLLHDRQTIGGYPKLGAVFSGDLYKLGQLMPGANLHFEAMDIYQAQAELLLEQRRREQQALTKGTP